MTNPSTNKTDEKSEQQAIDIQPSMTSHLPSMSHRYPPLTPPLTSLHPLLRLTNITSDTPTQPRLIPSASPLNPDPSSSPPSPPPRHTIIKNSPSGKSATGSLTVRPEILGSQQSTLKPGRYLSPFVPSQQAVQGTWEETDSLTARPPAQPHWIGSLGEVKMVDELEVEVCVLCGRERPRVAVEVKEFDLGQSPEGDQGETIGIGLGVGRWMICKDTESCDGAVEKAVFAEGGED